MGAKDWMLVYADRDVGRVLRAGPALDRDATQETVEQLFPDVELVPIGDGSLADNANPDKGFVYAGCYPGVTIVCIDEVAVDVPSQLPARFLAAAAGRRVYVHAMHSGVDWAAFAVWDETGALQRAVSLSPDSGILENVGTPLEFEAPYWSGERPAVAPEDDDEDEPYPLPFHPLEFSEDALRALFGFSYEGLRLDDDPDLEVISLIGYAIRLRGAVSREPASAIRRSRWSRRR